MLCISHDFAKNLTIIVNGFNITENTFGMALCLNFFFNFLNTCDKANVIINAVLDTNVFIVCQKGILVLKYIAMKISREHIFKIYLFKNN